jgi:hypothetical protein
VDSHEASDAADVALRSTIARRRMLRLGLIGGSAAVFGWRGSVSWAAPPPSATEVRFDHIDGTPLYFWRFSKATAGRRIERQACSSTAAFHERLVRWVRDLRALAFQYGGFAGMDRIVTAGMFVDKPGQHGLGQAMDLDQVRWANGAITPFERQHASNDLTVVRRYLALDAVCRRHFRYVLDGAYNADHADHLHMDFAGGQIRCDRASRSDTVFVQQTLNAFQGVGLPVDGVWGPATQAAFDQSRRRLGVQGDPGVSTDAWRFWLLGVAACGFANVEFARAPVVGLDPLAQILDPILGPIQDGLEELLGQLG